VAVKWPEGITSASLSCGIKRSGRPDLGVLLSEKPLQWAGVFTQNAAAAAPVQWSRAHLGKAVRALVVNSGNANACTGPAGDAAVATTAEAAASTFGLSPDEILISSTGPIGMELPVDRIVAALPDASAGLSPEMEPFFHAIRTTDSRVKLAASGPLVGVAKGAAMIAPNMATMLAFLATDAPIESGVMQGLLAGAVNRSFNRICIDACESTNDSVYLFSTGTGDPVSLDEFSAALDDVCATLAEQIVRDAEGGTRVVSIEVTGAADEEAAARLGRAVAASELWRAAMHGSDPKWGRVLSAMGSVDRSLALDKVSVSIGDVEVFATGAPTGSVEAAAAQMDGDFSLSCTVGDGAGAATVLACDLSPDYVKLNAFGTT
jgi:glutamate N-acetyltransferase/amino-acid N-acetyltransferase